jgi:hypothetical protein
MVFYPCLYVIITGEGDVYYEKSPFSKGGERKRESLFQREREMSLSLTRGEIIFHSPPLVKGG